MDIMLYIIAGLVVIVVIGVLFMRKNKAQKPVQPPLSTDNMVNSPAKATNTAASSAPATKFDNLTVAQRFMDQQRYDKALEALERGLIEKPHDSALSLKMLHIYAITNQYDHFHSTYDAINMHSDAATIAEAQQLKTLLDQEQAETVPATLSTGDTQTKGMGLSLSSDQPEDAISSNEALSFDLDQDTDTIKSPVISDAKTADTDTMAVSDSKDSNDTHDDIFDLTLDDLESDTIIENTNDEASHPESAPTIASSLDTNDHSDELSFEDSIVTDASETSELAASTQADDVDNLDDDFKLNFESSNEGSDDDALESNTDDDFVLDFEDLALDVADLEATPVDTPEPESDDALALDTFTLDEHEEASDNATLDIGQPTFDDNTPIADDFSLDLDDHLNADDSLDTENAQAAAPVTAESLSDQAQDNVDSQQPVDFAAQFAADFDFVKSLDSQQVTLDLAAKYLELGEYDSAKRLLIEVVDEGSEEQQQQAQSLLARTA